MEAGIIRYNSSSFASLVVLVRKVLWKLEVVFDYMALNKNIIKDKFLISMIDDPLDELYGAKFFSKLDSRSRYHQIRVLEEDIKTTFKTHDEHYELIVMPFGFLMPPQHSEV